MSEALPPVCHRLVVPLSVDDAFALFTQGMARWWPFGSHSCSGDRAVTVEFEPRVGGSVTELDHGGGRHPWGTVTAWDPPHHLAMTWHPGQAAEKATALSLRFTAVPGGCELALEHGGWGVRGDEADRVRDSYQEGWAHVLGRYAGQARS